MNIYDIKRATAETSPYFFTRETLRFFGQRMRDFKVKKQPDGRIKIAAPIIHRGIPAGETVRYFNPINNQLELI